MCRVVGSSGMALPAGAPFFVETELQIVEAEVLPMAMINIKSMLLRGVLRRSCTGVVAAGLVQALACEGTSAAWSSYLARAGAVAVLGPPLVLKAATGAEFALRCIASLVAQWRAAAWQKRALLADIESGFEEPVPLDSLMYDPRCTDGARVFTHRASFGVTPLWFKRGDAGWLWTSDLWLWQSVSEPRAARGGQE